MTKESFGLAGTQETRVVESKDIKVSKPPPCVGPLEHCVDLIPLPASTIPRAHEVQEVSIQYPVLKLSILGNARRG